MKNATLNSKVRHPCAGMTKAQRDLFERIAVGMEGPMHPQTLAALKDKGLIYRGSDRIVGRDRFGVIAIPQYEVPLHIHMQWCEWCSENVKEEA